MKMKIVTSRHNLSKKRWDALSRWVHGDSTTPASDLLRGGGATVSSMARAGRIPGTLLLLLMLSILGIQPSARSAPPELMTYQGFLVDANGNPLATNNPANYPIIFRVYSVSSGGTPLWAEQQIVTVDRGHFSAMLGEGTPVSGEARPSLSTLFSGPNSAERYMSLSVTIGSTTSEMLPRLRLLPAPYAFQASSASSLVQPNGAPAIQYANNRLEVTGELFASGNLNLGGTLGLPTLNVSGTATAGYLAVNPQTPGGVEGGELLLRGTGTPSVPDWILDNQGGNARLVTLGAVRFSVSRDGDGFFQRSLGIGASPVDATLDVEGTLRVNDNDLFFRGGTDRNHGLGWYGGAKPFSGITLDGPLLYGASGGALGAKTPQGDVLALRWNNAGNVGIGTATPTAQLTVNGTVAVNGANTLEFGAGISGKESSAGKLGYRTFSDGLDIVGAGNTQGTRKITLWAEGGATVRGPLNVGANGQLRLHHDLINASWVNPAGSSLFYTPTNSSFIWSHDTVERLRIDPNGNVGIGTSSPGVKLDVVGTTSITMQDNGYNSNDNANQGNNTFVARNSTNPGGAGIELYGMSGGGDLPNGARFNAPVSIRANGWIATGMGFTAYSDRRIKRDLQPSVTSDDLSIIRKLKLTHYRMVDPADGGSQWHKGLIAQEVEEVLPEAVKRSTEFVPDLFTVASGTRHDPTAKTLSVTLAKEHGLKAGDRVRLHVDGSRMDVKVGEILSAREFVVGPCERAPQKVLIYGREVSDFRSVDYDRIFSTGIGAIQELANKIQALESSQERIAQLEAKAVATAREHQQEVAQLKREIGLLKDRSGTLVGLEALQAELADLKKVVARIVATRNPLKTAASSSTSNSTDTGVLRSESETSPSKSIAAR